MFKSECELPELPEPPELEELEELEEPESGLFKPKSGQMIVVRDWLVDNCLRIKSLCDIVVGYAQSFEGRKVATLAHDFSVLALTFLSNGHLVCGCSSGGMHLWDPLLNLYISAIPGHTYRPVQAQSLVGLSSNKIALSASDGGVYICDAANHEMIDSLGGVLAVAGDMLASARQTTIRVFNVFTGMHLKTIVTSHTSTISSIAIVDENRILSASWDRHVHLWDVSSGECLQRKSVV